MATATKLDKGVFRHVEAELYRYHDTKREIMRMRNDILYGTSPTDESGGVKHARADVYMGDRPRSNKTTR